MTVLITYDLNKEKTRPPIVEAIKESKRMAWEQFNLLNLPHLSFLYQVDYFAWIISHASFVVHSQGLQALACDLAMSESLKPCPLR